MEFASSIAQLKRACPNNLNEKYPLLFWSLSFLIGNSFALFPHPALLIPLFFQLLIDKRKIQCALLVIVGFLSLQMRYPDLNKIPSSSNGIGYFTVESIAPSQSPFHRTLSLKGHLRSYKVNDKGYHNIPCSIFTKKAPLGRDLLLEGTLKKKDKTRFLFKPKVIKELGPHSLNIRFENKEKIRRFFQKKVKDKQTQDLFITLATGETQSRLLSMEFRKLGLGHLLAISGLHFALIAAFLQRFFQLLFSWKVALFLLLASLFAYFLFLGVSPSILRAFVMISLYVIGILHRRQISALNLLGAALLIDLLIDPLSLTQIGFHLSFLATGGILLFYRLFHEKLRIVLPTRTLNEALTLPHFQKWGYIFTTFLRKSLSLNISVFLITLPVVLYHFSAFPLLSLIYNLFFPALFSVSLILLPLSFLPPILWINEHYTRWLLKLTSYPPEIINFHLHLNHLPFTFVVLITTILLFLGLRSISLTKSPFKEDNMR